MTVTDTNALVDEIANRFWEKILELDPVQATILGDDRFDDRLPDLSPEGRAKEAALSREVLAEAETIGRDELETEGVITRDMLMLIARNALEAQERKLYQLAVDHIWGVQTMPVLIAQYQKADSTEGLEKLLKRYAAYPTLIDQQIETLREGIADGRTSAAVPVRRAIEQIDRMLTLAPEDYPAVKVLSAILGGGMAGRFFSDLRDKQALAYTTAAQYPSRVDQSFFLALLGTAPENVAKAEAALREQLARIQREPVADEELRVGKAYLLGNLEMDRRTNARQAWYLGSLETAGVGYEYLDRYTTQVRAVTAADVQRVARRYLSTVRTIIVR